MFFYFWIGSIVQLHLLQIQIKNRQVRQNYSLITQSGTETCSGQLGPFRKHRGSEGVGVSPLMRLCATKGSSHRVELADVCRKK